MPMRRNLFIHFPISTMDSINHINGMFGAYGSGGSMSNPMYRNICATGRYEPLSGRNKRRLLARLRRKSEPINRMKVSSPNKGGFGNSDS